MAEGKLLFDILVSVHDTFEEDAYVSLGGLCVTIKTKGKSDIDISEIKTLEHITKLTGVLLTCAQVSKQNYLNQIERVLETFEPDARSLTYQYQARLETYYVCNLILICNNLCF